MMADREPHIKRAEEDFRTKVNPDVQHFIDKLAKDQQKVIQRHQDRMTKLVQYIRSRGTSA